ncbi:transglutaminase-like domain-containing protein [Mucilaginibacter sp. BJC16-A38]|uniref:transglutaminase-like domain-containing protein n=1 Tax=Mucilaginibacter phenanthrenivorans TaxID=1234842 RepID=UPI0021582A9F|nr:transglutaminase-like domain-containing protein [Mucilaginibacter phenanthrenivorans]MCR8559409.1 transglutaminase-like domain-containing protein [Mucilaginibacter phenanthrenivorans]
MKKLLLTCAICVFALVTDAQSNKEADDFGAYTTTVMNNMHVDYTKKEYKQAITIGDEWFSRYDKLSADFKKNNPGYLPVMYYNQACYTALAGQKTRAVDYIKKAAATGFTDYANMANDSDLVSLHDDPEYKTALALIREKGDYNYVLKKAGSYNRAITPDLPVFTYQSADAPELANFRKLFNLDSISGNGDEINKIKNLLYWAHNVVRHDGSANNPPSKNAIDLISVCKKDDRGVNCRMMATILKDAYQAEGFKARMVTCMPKDTADFDCHVITVVWSKTLNKWVWMDPTFNAYVSDEKGNLLNIEEVRERLINDKPLVLNDDANWNNKVKQTKEDYLGRYMSKNLYWLKCSAKSEWDLETYKAGKANMEYVDLYPGGFSVIHGLPKKTAYGQTVYASNNPDYFWQKPAGENKPL